jgi:hypothetical protein
MECPKCGKEVDDKKLFCAACDAPLHLEEEIFVPEVVTNRAGAQEQSSDADGFQRGSPVSEAGPIGAPVKAEFMFRGRLRRSWVIRILITLLILAILIAALLLIAYSRRASGMVTSHSEWAAQIGRGPSSKEGQCECSDHYRDYEYAVGDISGKLPCPHVACEARDVHRDGHYPVEGGVTELTVVLDERLPPVV